jgi:predicted nucleic acid-binding protein
VRILLDTNILLRITPEDPDVGLHRLATQSALIRLVDNYVIPCIATQSLAEYWNRASRPQSDMGLGITSGLVRQRIDRFSRSYTVLREAEETHETWLNLCCKYDVIGKTVHDARLAALALSHGIRDILTLNADHFRRFIEIKTHTPADILV